MIYIACCGIIEKHGKILLTRRKVNPFKDKFVLPGGKLDFGENLKECLKREILEETGLKILKASFFDYKEILLKDRYYLIMYFKSVVKDFNLKINEDEISEILWIDRFSIDKIDIAPKSKEIIRKYFNDSYNR